MRIYLTLEVTLDEARVGAAPGTVAQELADRASDAVRWHDAVVPPVSAEFTVGGGYRPSAQTGLLPVASDEPALDRVGGA
jgi:hypothetical protein